MTKVYSDDCDHCDGSGDDPDYDEMIEIRPRAGSCRECSGRGRIDYEDVPCRECGMPVPVLAGLGVKDSICDDCGDADRDREPTR